MYYLANWLDEFEKSNKKTSLFTSHTDLIDGIDDVIGAGAGFNKAEHDGGYAFSKEYNICAIFPLNTYAIYNDTDVPELSFEGNEIPSEFLSTKMINAEGIEYTPEKAALTIGWGSTIGNENMLSWEIDDLANPKNITLPEVELHNSRNTYTLSEYAQVIRDYYALVDPVGAITLLNSKSDDFSNAQQEYDFSAQNTINCLSRLRGSEKEYEEAVALFEEWQTQQEVVESSVEIESEMAQLTEISGVENEPQLNNNTVDTDTESDVAYQAESEVLSSTPIVTEVISTGEVTEYQDSSKETRVEAPDSKNDGLLAQVLSYIFNGGAIALILPAGLFRKKEIIV